MSAATELIEKALGVIRDKGWTRGIREDRCGHVCALGALDRASGVHSGYEFGNSDYARAVEILNNAIPQDWSPRAYTTWPPSRVAQYNNDHDQETVEHWFAKAALHEGIHV